MTGALIILAVTVVTGVILFLTRGRGETAAPVADESVVSAAVTEEEPEGEVCCGRHAVCEKGLLRPDELYYNDEELDRFAGRESNSYTDDEINEFREVLYTLGNDEVYAWGTALTQREVALPDDLRDEWVMLCS